MNVYEQLIVAVKPGMCGTIFNLVIYKSPSKHLEYIAKHTTGSAHSCIL